MEKVMDSLDLYTIRDNLKSFTFSAPRELVENFRDAISQRRIVEANLKLPVSYQRLVEPILSPNIGNVTTSDQTTMEAVGYALYFFVTAILHEKHKPLFEESKIDYEDSYRKRVFCARLTHSLCNGYTVLFGKASKSSERGFTSMIILSLFTFHKLQDQLRRLGSGQSATSTPSSGGGVVGGVDPARSVRLINMSNRKFITEADARGEWRIFVDAQLGGDTGGHIDFFVTIKARSEVADTVALASTRLPPLPEEEDDICEPVQFTPLRAIKGNLGPALLPRDPRNFADRLPKPRVVGLVMKDQPAVEQRTTVRVEVASPALEHQPALQLVPRRTEFNQDFSARDGRFGQYVFFYFHVVNTSDTLPVSLACGGTVRATPRAAEESVTVEGPFRFGVVVPGGGRYGGDSVQWLDTDVTLPPASDAMIAIEATFTLSGEPGNDNATRQCLHRGHFDRTATFAMELRERRSGAAHHVQWRPAAPAVTFPTAVDVAKSWDAPKLLAFVFADHAITQRRHCAGVYLSQDGLVVRREGQYLTYDLDAFNYVGWQATRHGLTEVPIDRLATSSAEYTVTANFLIDRSDFPPMPYAVKIDVSTPTNQSSDACLIELPGERESWIAAARPAPEPEDQQRSADSVRSDLSSLRSRLGSWQLVEGSEGGDASATSTLRSDGGSPVGRRIVVQPGAAVSSAAGGSNASAASTESKMTIIYHEKLGSGAYGVVFKAFDNSLGKFVAVKEMPVIADVAVQRAILHEFERLTQLQHKNIVTVYSLSIDENTARIVMEWMPAGSVASVLAHTGHRLHESVIRRYLRDALEGLAYLHGQNILHLDVKPGNLLLSSDGIVKLSDFGTSKSMGNGSTLTTASVLGTPAYMPPEAITAGRYYTGSDIWSLAISAVELATAQHPWAHLPNAVTCNQIPLMFHIGSAQPPNHCPPLPEHLSEDLRRILSACFAPTVAARPSAAALLTDPYFVSDALPPDAEPLAAFQREVSDVASGAAEEGDASYYSSTTYDAEYAPTN